MRKHELADSLKQATGVTIRGAGVVSRSSSAILQSEGARSQIAAFRQSRAAAAAEHKPTRTDKG